MVKGQPVGVGGSPIQWIVVSAWCTAPLPLTVLLCLEGAEAHGGLPQELPVQGVEKG